MEQASVCCGVKAKTGLLSEGWGQGISKGAQSQNCFQRADARLKCEISPQSSPVGTEHWTG